MESENTINFFDYIGAESPSSPQPTPTDSETNATPVGEGASPSDSQATDSSTQIVSDDTTFSASDLKAIFGDFESLDSIKSKYETVNQKASKYDEYEPFLNDQETLFKELETPFVDDTLASLNSFMKHTGIKDRSVAEKFVGKTAEEIKQSPIQTMALAQVLEDPSLLKDISFEDLCDAIADENNTYADVTFEDAPKIMKMKIGKNVAVVEEKLKNISDNRDILSSLRNKYNESKETVEKVVNEWKPIVGDLTKKAEYDYEIEGYKIKAQVSEETKKAIENEIFSIIKSNPALPSSQDVELMNNYIRSRVENLEAKNIYKALINAAKGEAREQTAKEFHNGSEIIKQEKSSGNSNEKSQLQRYFESQY